MMCLGDGRVGAAGAKMWSIPLPDSRAGCDSTRAHTRHRGGGPHSRTTRPSFFVVPVKWGGTRQDESPLLKRRSTPAGSAGAQERPEPITERGMAT